MSLLEYDEDGTHRGSENVLSTPFPLLARGIDIVCWALALTLSGWRRNSRDCKWDGAPGCYCLAFHMIIWMHASQV